MSTGKQQTLQKYAQPLLVATAKDDTIAPFPFKLWYSSYQGIIPGQEYSQYNDYLIRWYKNRSQNVNDVNLQTKLNYLSLLRQLQLFFTNEEAENWYSKVNLDDEKELLLSIPYFARKLKDISLYYLQLRQNIKESRLRYNQAGTDVGVIQQLQKLFLTNYTQKPNSFISIPSYVWKNVPELSAVSDTISIEVEELYDTHTYFDQIPTLPVSAYYDVNNNDLVNFLTTKNLAITSTDWIYKLGAYSLSATPFDSETIALSANSLYQENIYNDIVNFNNTLSEKYLGSSKLTTTSTTTSSSKDFYTAQFQPGNNFLLWPNSVYPGKDSTFTHYQSVPLSSSGLETVATAGSSINLADTIFVKSKRGTVGAWFRNRDYDYSDVTMRALLEASKKTIFRYPYPGYGLSAENTEWSGYDLATSVSYTYLDNDFKQSIQNKYWTTSFELTSTIPLLINDTTLVDNKAYANKDYNRADRIKVRSSAPDYNATEFSDIEKESWLYRFDKTDISIQSNGDSVIYWPFEKIDPAADFPTYYPKNVSNYCLPLAVSAIDFSFATAGNSLSSSDAIYKITNYKHTKDLAVECCWLSGAPAYNGGSNNISIQQPSLQANFASGTYTQFIWNGPDHTDANDVFITLAHQPGCDFLNNPKATYLDYNSCTCKQVMFTPFGHPGTTYNEYNSFVDFIILDNFTPNKIDLSTWQDNLGNSYASSPAFCWYKTNNVQGWGDGSWRSNSSAVNNKFYLKSGYRYIYYRSEARTQNTETVTLPEYILRYNYNNYKNLYGKSYKWIKAKKNEKDEWINTNLSSTMILAPGELLIYSRNSTYTNSVTGLVTSSQDVSENHGSIWCDYDYITIGNSIVNLPKQVTVNYPTSYVLSPSSAGQYPATNTSNLLSVKQWSLLAPGKALQYFKEVPSFSFVPNTTGTYSVCVTAVTATVIPPPTLNYYDKSDPGRNWFSYAAGTTGLYFFDNRIPNITAINFTNLVPDVSSYSIPVAGYVLNIPLYGWDYSTSIANAFARPVNAGARPYWGKTYTDKDTNTNYKGIASWGSPLRLVDSYNFISQPDISDITFDAGAYVEYNRNYPVDITWNQPVELKTTINENTWCTLNFTTTAKSNLAYQLNNITTELAVTPTTATSPILLQNYVDNEPVEIYYNAINALTWNITAIPVIETTVYENQSTVKSIQAATPWANLTNQFYPTVATFPSFENINSTTKIGGFFTPKNLGTSVYVDQDYTFSYNLSSPALTGYFEDSNKKIGGRGLTKRDIDSPYNNISENSIWLKEPTITSSIAGTIKKDIFKKYQKFLPYQSGYETNSKNRTGLITPTSRQTPWGGKDDSQWTDLANKPVSPTGELNVNAWANSQILKQTGLQIDNWVTDIFGNQYGLYKNILKISPVIRKNVPGEIWTRKNSQFTSPASISLTGVFDTYKGTNFINELTGTGILKIDMFFDTLYIETSGAILLEKIKYDYLTDNIFSLADEARFISLTMPVTANINNEINNKDLSIFTFAKAGETWFFPEEKLVTVTVCGLSGGVLTPELYQLNLLNQNFKKIFPATNSDTTTLNKLSSLNLTYIDPPVISYNNSKKEYMYSILGKDTDLKDNIIELKIKDTVTNTLDSVTVYKPTLASTIVDPPFIDQDLNKSLTISIVTYFDGFSFQCTTNDSTAIFTATSKPDWLALTPDGLFTGIPPLKTSVYNVLFTVTNNIGPTYYNLNIEIIYDASVVANYMILDSSGVESENDPGYGYLIQENGYKIIEDVQIY